MGVLVSFNRQLGIIFISREKNLIEELCRLSWPVGMSVGIFLTGLIDVSRPAMKVGDTIYVPSPRPNERGE